MTRRVRHVHKLESHRGDKPRDLREAIAHQQERKTCKSLSECRNKLLSEWRKPRRSEAQPHEHRDHLHFLSNSGIKHVMHNSASSQVEIVTNSSDNGGQSTC